MDYGVKERPFGDLAGLAAGLPRTWDSIGELACAEYLWAAASADLPGGDTPRERTARVVRLLTVFALMTEFYGYAYSDGQAGDWAERFLPTLWDHDEVLRDVRATMPPLAGDDELDSDEWLMSWLREEVRADAQLTARQLTDTFGDHLHPILMESRSDAVYPLTDEQIAEHLNSPTVDDLAGYDWINEGMRL